MRTAALVAVAVAVVQAVAAPRPDRLPPDTLDRLVWATTPPGAPARDVVRTAQVRAGAAFVRQSDPLRRQPLVCFGEPQDTDRSDAIRRLAAVAAARETTADGRTFWYEWAVVELRRREQYVEALVRAGQAPPQDREKARGDLLRAEAERLAAQAAPAPPPAPAPQPGPGPPADYTAFPDLTVPTKAVLAGGGPNPAATDLDAVLAPFTAAVAVPLPPTATPRERVRAARLAEAVKYVRLARALADTNRWNGRMAAEYIDGCRNLVAAATDGELAAAKRVSFRGAGVVLLKDLERLTDQRVKGGQDFPHALDRVRFYRLDAEADLLAAKEAVR